MDNFNGYGGYGTYTYPTYTNNFGRQYGSMPNMTTPYNNQMPNYSQSQQMNMQNNPPTLQPQTNNPNIIQYVNGIEGAKAFLVPPNSTITLFDSDSNHFYRKITNEQGQAVLKQFEYTEITPQTGQNQAKQSKSVNYITQDDLPKIEANIVAKIKQDLFGKKNNNEVKKDVQ